MSNNIDKLQLCDLNFSYGNNKIYDHPISVTFEKDKVYMIKGPNGCGKSTLAKIILKIWNNYEGNIFINDINLKNIPRKDLLKLIGITFQNTPIFHDTVRNNICMGNEGNIEKLEKLIGFDEDLRLMNRNLDSWLKDQSSLSGGQAQKIGILRALFQNKSIYIFDEATSHLDQKSKKQFFDMIQKIKNEKIIILISHDEDAMRYVDEVIEIKGGTKLCM